MTYLEKLTNKLVYSLYNIIIIVLLQP